VQHPPERADRGHVGDTVGQRALFVATDGGIFNYGNAGFASSLGGSGANDVAGRSLGL